MRERCVRAEGSRLLVSLTGGLLHAFAVLKFKAVINC